MSAFTRLKAFKEDPSLLATELDAALDEYEFENGLTADGVAELTSTTITFTAHYKTGDGRTPYANRPEPVMEYMNTEAYTGGEGTVVFETDDQTINLPKHLHFEETVSFDESVASLADLETELETILGSPVALGAAVEHQ